MMFYISYNLWNILCFSKNIVSLKLGKLPLSDKAKNEYRYQDENGLFRRAILLDKTRGRHFYPVTTKSGNILRGPWMKTEEEFKKLNSEGAIYWTSGGDEQPYGKIYLKDSEGAIPNDCWGIEYGTNQRASLELEKIFENRFFDFPKPVSLIYTIVTLGAEKDDIILDFFSGSATTAHAVMQLNAEDGGNRRFICVQLPELTTEDSEAFKAGYKNICEIGKERIRRAGEKIKNEIESGNEQLKIDEEPKKVPDIGFRVFKLDSSNLKKWNPDFDNIERTLDDMINNYVPDRTEEDVVYEFMLKMGLDLSYPVDVTEIDGKKVYSIGFGALMMCLDDNITVSVAEGMVKMYKELTPETWKVIFKDEGFADDCTKTNIKLTLIQAGLEEDAFTTV